MSSQEATDKRERGRHAGYPSPRMYLVFNMVSPLCTMEDCASLLRDGAV